MKKQQLFETVAFFVCGKLFYECLLKIFTFAANQNDTKHG